MLMDLIELFYDILMGESHIITVLSQHKFPLGIE
jgi:hypothetical protein